MDKFSLKIDNHQFIRELASDIQPTIEKRSENKKYTPSELELYVVSVFDWATRIRSCFQTLEHAAVYLGYYRTNKRYQEAGIWRSHHINYHYFYYAITVVKIMDVSLILTDKIFRLGNPEKLCRLENIIKNSWVRPTSINKLLKKLDSIVEPWRETRHFFVHRGETINRETMHMLEMREILIEQEEPIEGMSSEVKILHQLEISRINKEFERIGESLFNAVSELFSGLLPTYTSWYKVLKQVSDG